MNWNSTNSTNEPPEPHSGCQLIYLFVKEPCVVSESIAACQDQKKKIQEMLQIYNSWLAHEEECRAL